MAEQQRNPTEADDEVTILITPTIERDYRRRNVFEEMWSERADKVMPGGAFVHRGVCVEFAEEILEDAREQRFTSDGPRGNRAAYTALVRQITGELRRFHESQTLPDPGRDAMLTAAPPSPARFKVGDAAAIWAPGEDYHLQLVEIVDEYRLRRVTTSCGEYMDQHGKRVTYFHGYLAKAPGDRAYVFPLHQLRDPDQNVRHLRRIQ
ncbi:hypothetical protein RAMLITH_01700 [Ramlibacter sp. RBP-2]|uniref:Uncharacterized protein n=1 Tax=Ramlibacter lithotrophicus TaxID=2606681 RepID=A0A7X6I4R6_9BURK|nr:hypothetical protein [Ramlibacter lithotrophicus]NKE64521.1 hypothetical protein [Ramlibacter lithotrophicus]